MANPTVSTEEHQLRAAASSAALETARGADTEERAQQHAEVARCDLHHVPLGDFLEPAYTAASRAAGFAYVRERTLGSCRSQWPSRPRNSCPGLPHRLPPLRRLLPRPQPSSAGASERSPAPRATFCPECGERLGQSGRLRSVRG